MYNEYDPHTLLSPYIDKYWVAQGVFSGEYCFKVFPDGCIDLIVAFGSSAQTRQRKEGQAFVVGTYTSFTEQCFNGSADMFGIRFKPAGITAFLLAQIFEFTNGLIDMPYQNSLFDHEFSAFLPDTENRLKQIAHIENYLISKLPDLYTIDKRISYAIDLVKLKNGNITPTELADKACMSIRQFERKFKSITGVSPKTYTRIARFNYTRHYLQVNKEQNLLTTAFDCGYYDHAHLIKDFQEFAGELPSYFRQE